MFGFPGQPDIGEEMLLKIREKAGFEEVREGDSGHMSAEIRGMQSSAGSGMRSSVSPALPTPTMHRVGQGELAECCRCIVLGGAVGSDLI